MAKEKKEGICHICGKYRELTDEHYPPKEAFNKLSYIEASKKDIIERIVNPGIDSIPKSRTQQGGISDYTLCGKCNNDTGSWYGNRYIDWCYKGMEILIRSEGKPSLINIYSIYPLSVIKQIISLFFSANREDFGKENPQLQNFILNKENIYLPPRYRIFCYFSIESRHRSIGSAVMKNFETGQSITLSEFSFPPFGYVMTISSEPPDQRLFEITHFSQYGYDELRDMKLKINVLSTDAILPGIYISRDEITKKLKEIAEGKKQLGDKSEMAI